MKQITIYILATVFIVFLYLIFIYQDERYEMGDKAIELIEMYKIKNGRFPSSFSEVGLNYDDMTGPIFYTLEDNKEEYRVWFGTTLGESEMYYSKYKKWRSW